MTSIARAICILATICLFASFTPALPQVQEVQEVQKVQLGEVVKEVKVDEEVKEVELGIVQKESPVPTKRVSYWKRTVKFVNAQQGAITALATLIIALAAIATTILTRSLTRENKLLRKAGKEPEVVAYLMTDQRHKTMVNFVLANVGRGPARDVEFVIDADEKDFTDHEVLLGSKAERTAISILPQGERVESFFGAGHDLYKETRLKPFKVSVLYKDIDGKARKGDFNLDVSQFEGLITLGNSAEHEVAEALKKLEKHFDHFASGFNKLKVETITANQVRRENKKFLEQQREQANRAKAEEQAGSNGPSESSSD